MKSVLLDTNVLSELAKRVPDERVVEFCLGLDKAFISVITMHELLHGAKLVKASEKRTRLLKWVRAIQEQYSKEILSVSSEIAEIAADMRAKASKKGSVLHIEDALIAATAFDGTLELATRNVKDFAGTGIELINPWEF